MAPCSQDGRRPRVTARGRHVADIELERLEAAEVPAGEAGHDIQPVALSDDLGDVRPTERDPVQDVEAATERQLGMAAGRGAHAGDGEAEDGDEGVGIARAAWGKPCELAVERVVDVEGGEREVDRDGEPRIRRDRLGGEGKEPGPELVPAVSRDLEARGAGMTTEADEEIRAALQGRAEI